MTLQSAILYQNASKDVILIDIPKSIALAQGTSEAPFTGDLFSTSPLQSPYPSTEPKSARARNELARHGMTSEGDGSQIHLPKEALDEVGRNWIGLWCLERRIRRPSVEETSGHRHVPDDQTRDADVMADPIPSNGKPRHWQALEPYILPAKSESVVELDDLEDRLIHNPNPHMVSVSFSSEGQGYRIPPLASFVLSNINTASTTSFSMAVLTQLSEQTTTAGAGQFDFILLDPPWPNRSARRSRSYEVEPDPMESLGPMLGQHIAPGGIVACWITNSLKARINAVAAFDAWEVELLQEWKWLKVTSSGDPVSPIDGLWRKPYETLLLGRKRAEVRSTAEVKMDDVKKRILIGVPDSHSRKPHIKELIEPFMYDPREYRALEIFARNLTARWWAWGDDVLKFNHDACFCDHADEIGVGSGLKTEPS